MYGRTVDGDDGHTAGSEETTEHDGREANGNRVWRQWRRRDTDGHRGPGAPDGGEYDDPHDVRPVRH